MMSPEEKSVGIQQHVQLCDVCVTQRTETGSTGNKEKKRDLEVWPGSFRLDEREGCLDARVRFSALAPVWAAPAERQMERMPSSGPLLSPNVISNSNIRQKNNLS